MKTKWLPLFAAVWVAVSKIPAAALAGPPPLIHIPGNELAKLDAKWLSPFVLELGGKNAGEHLVRWINQKDGLIWKELRGRGVIPLQGVVTEQLPTGGHQVHAMNARWDFFLPLVPNSESGYWTSTPDSVTFVRSYRLGDRKIGFQVYRNGKLAGDYGPFWSYRGEDVHLANDGSVALIHKRLRR